MKNKTVMIFALLIMLGTTNNVFAANPWPANTKKGVRTNEVFSGRAYLTKEGGVPTQVIMGEVKSVLTEKGVFVIEDKHDGITATISTDSQTIASLQRGQMVTVKLRSGSPVAQSVVIAGSEKHRNNNTLPSGRTYYGKEGSVQTKTIVGVVESVNSEKNAFVIKGEGAPTTVLTDFETIASLRPGQRASVKLYSGNPVAVSVLAGK